MHHSRISASRSKLPLAEAESNIVVFGDSQAMFGTPERLATQTAMAQWVLDNRVARNLSAFVHVGDITDDATYVSQYATAYGIYSRLFGVVPGVMVTGNHDEIGLQAPTSPARDTSVFNAVGSVVGHGFGDLEPHLTGVKDAGKIQNSHLELTLGGHHVLIVGVEWAPRDATLTWAKGIIDAHAATYADSFVIVVTHAFLYLDGTVYPRPTTPGFGTWNPLDYAEGFYYDVNTGADIVTKVIEPCRNVKLVVSGHAIGAHCHAKFTRADGSTWAAVCQDYQGYEATPGTPDDRGWLYILTIDWANKHIRGKPVSAIGVQWPETYDSANARHNSFCYPDIDF